MKFVLISMLSAIAFVSQTESLSVHRSHSNFLLIIETSILLNPASRMIDEDVLKISQRVENKWIKVSLGRLSR